jgi:hypothetical protein
MVSDPLGEWTSRGATKIAPPSPAPIVAALLPFAVLSESVDPVIVTSVRLSTKMPPPADAVFLAIVLFDTVRRPSEVLAMPPPNPGDLLCAIIEPPTVTVPP